MLVIGRNPVLEALKFNPGSVRKIILLNGLSDGKVKEITRLAGKNNIIVELKAKSEFEKLFLKKDKSEGVSQGIAAEVSEYEYTELSALLDAVSSKSEAVLLILDEIQDPHNLGAIIRTASAAGTEGIIITEKNSAKINHTVIKASAGAVNYIQISLSKNIYKSISALKNAGFRIIGTSLNTSKSLFKTDFRGKNAVVLGNEGEGIRKNILKLCDEIIKIPIIGKTESLNVSVSAGVILYEILRRKVSV